VHSWTRNVTRNLCYVRDRFGNFENKDDCHNWKALGSARTVEKFLSQSAMKTQIIMHLSEISNDKRSFSIYNTISGAT
jgi:hypothetical protein